MFVTATSAGRLVIKSTEGVEKGFGVTVEPTGAATQTCIQPRIAFVVGALELLGVLAKSEGTLRFLFAVQSLVQVLPHLAFCQQTCMVLFGTPLLSSTTILRWWV